MSDLRDRIASVLRDHHSEEFPEPVVTHDSIDAILAAVAAALTSDAAVEAFEQTTGYDYTGAIVDGITAALAAVGVKGEGDE